MNNKKAQKIIDEINLNDILEKDSLIVEEPSNFEPNSIIAGFDCRETFELLEMAYEANTTISIGKRIDIIEKGIAKIKLIDFLLNLSYDKQLITNKKYIKLGLIMDDIIKYMSGWLKKTLKENDGA